MLLTQIRFAKQYGVGESHTNVSVYNHRHLTDLIVDSKIDDDVLDKYHKNVKKAYNLAHMIYFEINSYGVSDSDQARFIQSRGLGSKHSWCVYLGRDLFNVMPESILNIQPKDRMMDYIKIGNIMIRHLRRFDRCQLLRPNISNDKEKT